MKYRSLVLPVFLLLASAALAASPETVEEIDACIEANRPDSTSIQTVVIETHDRVGNKNEMDAKVYWKLGKDGNNQVLIHWAAPPDLRGAAVLMLEKGDRNDMFMHLPELGKTRRITQHMMSGSMLGMDFSYEDFERLQGMASDVSSSREADAEVEGRPTWVVVRVPEDSSEYERVVNYVDQETCVPLRAEFFQRGGELRKRMTSAYADIDKLPTGNVPRRIEIRDLLEGTETTIEVKELEVEVPISPKYFSQSQLDKIGG